MTSRKDYTPDQLARNTWAVRNLKAFKIQNGLTQEELAKEFGMSRTYFNLVLNHKKPATSNLIDLIEAKMNIKFNLVDELNLNQDGVSVNRKSVTIPTVQIDDEDLHTTTLELTISNDKVIRVKVVNN